MGIQCNLCTEYTTRIIISRNHVMKRVTLQWRQFWAFMWSFGSPFSSETYLQKREWSTKQQCLLGLQSTSYCILPIPWEERNSRWHAHLHTRKLELDNNVTLVQHIEEDLCFQVLWDPSSEDEEAGRAHGLCCSCTEEMISDRSTDHEGYIMYTQRPRFKIKKRNTSKKWSM
jgi:hypothetical protein